MIQVSVEKQKSILNFLKLIGKWLTYKRRKFSMVFKIVWFCLTLSLPENLNNSIFEKPIISQILVINNSRTIRAKSVNLQTLRKWIEYNFQKLGQRACFFYPFWGIDVWRKVGIIRKSAGYREQNGSSFSEKAKKCSEFVKSNSKVIELQV